MSEEGCSNSTPPLPAFLTLVLNYFIMHDFTVFGETIESWSPSGLISGSFLLLAAGE
jgi:hypothetical protein